MRNLWKVVLGLALFIPAAGFLAWYAWLLHQNKPYYTSMAAAKRCDHPLYEVRMEPTILTEGNSAVLQVRLRQGGRSPGHREDAERKAGMGTCEVAVQLLAPGFNYEPAEHEQSVTLPATLEQKLVVWVVMPKKAGSHELVVRSGLDTWVVRTTVLTTLGVTAKTAAWGALIMMILAGVYTVSQIVQIVKSQGRDRRGAR